MKTIMIKEAQLSGFRRYLEEKEKSEATVNKYLRDVRAFCRYCNGERISKHTVIAYKEQIAQTYAISSANSMLAALNSFFRYAEREDLCVRPFKLQQKIFCSEERELTEAEYRALIETAERRGDRRLSLLIQTICGMGIRVSELPFVTREAVERGVATVSCKGKTRSVFIVSALQKKLLAYAKEERIEEGMLFLTKGGRALDRSNVWREMKKLCTEANVSQKKVFPHNLRHLFAQTFYGIDKDIAKLADILGHNSINTTRIYIISTGEEHKRFMERMDLVR
ncbi:MAG: tyrosine-type recombinase/integrase [Clostridia bacterium]|nr:tyrosine-type recombinase/integrase [Clostridia bacterium]